MYVLLESQRGSFATAVAYTGYSVNQQVAFVAQAKKYGVRRKFASVKAQQKQDSTAAILA